MTRTIRSVIALLVSLAALVALGIGPADASATTSSGPVTLAAVGSGLHLDSSTTGYTTSANGPTIEGHQYTSNGQVSVYGAWHIGYVCASGPWSFSYNNWTASGNTTLSAMWYVNGGWDTAHVPSLSIHS